MATAIVSLVTGRTVSEDVGMTGEITLTGQVLQIGGVRDKVLAAQRAGLKKVILPRENEADLERAARRRRATRSSSSSPTHVDEVLESALDGGLVGAAAAGGRAPGGSEPQRNAEARGQLCARVRLAVRLRASGRRAGIPLPPQHEGDPVDEAAVLDLVLPGLTAGDGDGLAGASRFPPRRAASVAATRSSSVDDPREERQAGRA